MSLLAGFTYGAPDKKTLQLFIEDINLSQADAKGIASSHEVLFVKIVNSVVFKHKNMYKSYHICHFFCLVRVIYN